MMEKKTFILLLTALLLLFVGTFDHSLWTSDEPRVAEIAREMAASGDFLIPTLSNRPFLEHPPLYYAVAAVFWRVLGTGNEGFGRLASVLFAAGTLLVVFFGTRALYSEGVAAWSTLILATTTDFFLVSHKMVVDNALAFFITSALFSFILAYRGILKKGYVLFWVCLAGAFLTKGIIGPALPGVAAALFCLWQRDLSVIRKAWVIPGVLLVAAVILAWAWVLYMRGGKEFLSTFFLYNNLGRFASAGIYDGGHIKPFYYYLPAVLGGGSPWSLMLIAALVATRKMGDGMRFFCSWFFGGLILLSFASTKRGLYLLPLYPAMAVMVGGWMGRIVSEAPANWEKVVLRALLALLALLSLLLPAGYVKIGGAWPPAVAGFAVSLAMLFWASRTVARSLPEWLPVALALLLLTWVPLVFPQGDTMKSYQPFFRAAGAIVGHDRVIGNSLTETVDALCPFYGGFTVETITDREAFEQTILAGAAPYAMILPKRADEGLKRILESRGNKVLETGGPARRETQLWKLSARSGTNLEEGR